MSVSVTPAVPALIVISAPSVTAWIPPPTKLILSSAVFTVIADSKSMILAVLAVVNVIAPSVL